MTISEIITSKIYVVNSITDITTNITNRIIYTKDTNIFQYWNGSVYSPITNAPIAVVASGTLPTIKDSGTLIYVSDTENLYVSNGTDWIPVGGSSVTFVANEDALPVDGEDGDLAITIDNNILYYHNTTAWVSTQEKITLSAEVSIDLGGIEEGTSIVGKTNQEIWEMLLLKELFPSLSNPTSSFSMKQRAGNSNGSYSNVANNALFEVGTVLDLQTTATFNQGGINPQYSATSNKRSGLPNKYTYTGTQIAGDKASTALTDVQTVNDYTMIKGDQAWKMKVSYDAGVQPKSSKGNDFNSPYPAGTISDKTITIKGTYPYYATSSNITNLTKQGLVAVNSSTLTINFAGCTDSNFWKMELPACWTVNSYKINGGGFLNGNAANSLVQWTITDIEKDGKQYKQYAYGANNAAKLGATKIDVSITYNASTEV